MRSLGQTSYSEVRHLILDGDLALMRNGGLIGFFAGPYTHAAKCIWLRDAIGKRNTLMLTESREWYGGRIVTLSSQVRLHLGRVDIFRPKCNRETAEFSAILCARQAGHRYGWMDLARAAIKRIPIARRLLREKVSAWYEPKHCSHTVAWAELNSAKTCDDHFDPTPGIQPRDVEPRDLANDQHELMFKGLVI